ncbi:energy-coupling factor transporter transmembrane component T [Crocosphaera sp. XPORK-15E]|uniref:energy-coupling factor transporter transmembrane component T family protein n=1 Tax=Crocosphaera sp. XPORK-15E TaxID=3110247 RepID=UPI002B1F78D7|nr:energy-coupling factor transporter transmembrane component T [Crocosphaera sp. XPORK-15E]MEA5536207.1 energy-coupling factor transporter transmembrane component T [Crocosphaera sp. XPORK-15E]
MMKFETVDHDSIFTRLDFRTKLLMMGVITLIAFIWESPITGGILTLIVAFSCLFAGVKLEYLKTVLKVMIPFYLLLLVTMGFFNIEQVKTLIDRETLTPIFAVPKTWWWVGGLTMNQEGIIYGLNVIFKTLTMVLIIPLGIFTTDINHMVVGMVQVKIPYKIVFIFSSTLRFFPLLLEEIEGILDAQRLRGLALENMGLIRKGKVYAAIAVPLILNAMAKSQKLEVVLQSKAFSGSSQRTYLHQSILTKTDYFTMIFFLVLLLSVIFLYFAWGVGKFAWLIYT